jgi:hypothetical protein
MKSFRKHAKISILVIVAAFLISQAIRIKKSNPPVSSDIAADQAIEPILRRSCYNCHSNETVWPWYSNVAPISWLVASDVNEGRQHMNFSEWGNYDRDTQIHKLKGIAEKIEAGEMPPWYYLIMHGDERLNSAERNQIVAWTKTAAVHAWQQEPLTHPEANPTTHDKAR